MKPNENTSVPAEDIGRDIAIDPAWGWTFTRAFPANDPAAPSPVLHFNLIETDELYVRADVALKQDGTHPDPKYVYHFYASVSAQSVEITFDVDGKAFLLPETHSISLDETERIPVLRALDRECRIAFGKPLESIFAEARIKLDKEIAYEKSHPILV